MSENTIGTNFKNLSDREIAERLYNAYGYKLFNYAIRSWNLKDDEVWDILYDTLYGFIKSYARQRFASEKQIEALIWTIFKNKLRDKLRQNKRIRSHYQEVSYHEDYLLNNPEAVESSWLQMGDTMWMQENEKNPILTKLESILNELKDWERELVLCRANRIPYKVIGEMTGKKVGLLKVHYQRLKKRISEKLDKSLITIKRD